MNTSSEDFANYSKGMNRLQRSLSGRWILLFTVGFGIWAWYNHTVLVILAVAGLFVSNIAANLVDRLIIARAAEGEELRSRTVSASRFQIVDSAGKVRGWFGFAGQTSGDGDTPQLFLSNFEDGRIEENKNYGRIWIGFDKGSPQLKMYDAHVLSLNPFLWLGAETGDKETDEGQKAHIKKAGLRLYFPSDQGQSRFAASAAVLNHAFGLTPDPIVSLETEVKALDGEESEAPLARSAALDMRFPMFDDQPGRFVLYPSPGTSAASKVGSHPCAYFGISTEKRNTQTES